MLFGSQQNSFITRPPTTKQQTGTFQTIMNDIYSFTSNLSEIERQTKALKTEEQKSKLRVLVDKTYRESESIETRLANWKQNQFTDKEKSSFNRITAQYKELQDQFNDLRKEANSATQQLSKKLREEYMKSMVVNQPTRDNNLDLFDNMSGGGGSQTKTQRPMQIMLSKAAADTIAVETELAKETRSKLEDLHMDMEELVECSRELNGLLRDRQTNIDNIQAQLQQANSNMRKGTADLKVARSYTIGETTKKFSKIRTMGRLIGL
mmetsp:Transcript_285/g.519  ORF Transcript_285/g.519 Transcript_285/m.519 type:complete len:265 (+) Transcript_285:183-977(+)